MKKLSILLTVFLVNCSIEGRSQGIYVNLIPSNANQIVNNKVVVPYSSLGADTTIWNGFITMINSHTVVPPIKLKQINYQTNVFTLLGEDGNIITKQESSLTGVQKARCDSAIGIFSLTSLVAIMETDKFTANGVVLDYDTENAASGGLLERVLVTLQNIYNGIITY